MVSQLIVLATYLRGLGPKMPEALDIVQHMIDDLKKLLALVGAPAVFGAAGPVDLTDAESAAVAELEAEFGKHRFGATAGGDWLKAIFAFLAAHPELLSLILALLKPKA
jgi:hypothetical protein